MSWRLYLLAAGVLCFGLLVSHFCVSMELIKFVLLKLRPTLQSTTLIGTRANYNVRVKLHRHLLLQEAAFFDDTESGFLLSRLNNDVNKIGMVVSFHVNIVLRQLAQFLFGSVFLLRIQPKLALIAFTGIGLVAIAAKLYGDFARSLAEKVQELFATSSALAETSFHMSETIRAFDGVSVETEKYSQSQVRAVMELCMI